MLTNVIGGLQGMVDHALVGHLVGFKANAAIGVSWQIFIVVIVFISSLFTGMSVLVARFAGAGDEEKVNRTVYQAFLTAIFIALGIMAPIGYFVSPASAQSRQRCAGSQSRSVTVSPHHVCVQLRHDDLLHAEHRVAFRRRRAHADDARHHDDCAEHRFERRADSRAWSDSGVRNERRGDGNVHRFGTGRVLRTWQDCGAARGSISFPRGGGFGPNWTIIKSIFKFGLPTGIQGIAMNIGGVFMLAFIGSLAQSAAAQAAFAVSYTELFSLDHVDVSRIDGRGGGGGWSEPRRGQARSRECGGARGGAFRICGRGVCRNLLSVLSATTARDLRHARSGSRGDRRSATARAECFGLADRGGA